VALWPWKQPPKFGKLPNNDENNKGVLIFLINKENQQVNWQICSKSPAIRCGTFAMLILYFDFSRHCEELSLRGAKRRSKLTKQSLSLRGARRRSSLEIASALRALQ
jgi:hypothetical protein